MSDRGAGKLLHLPEIELDGRRIALVRLPFVIGRASASDLRLSDPRVSRTHCRIERSADGYRLISLSRKNGTRVNGRALRQALIFDGDHVTVGGSRLVFRGPPPAPAIRRRARRGRRTPARATLLAPATAVLMLAGSLLLLSAMRGAPRATQPRTGNPELIALRAEVAALREALTSRRPSPRRPIARRVRRRPIRRGLSAPRAVHVQRPQCPPLDPPRKLLRPALPRVARVAGPAPVRRQPAPRRPAPGQTRSRQQPPRRARTGKSHAPRSVTFYGRRIVGRRVVFIVDRSSSMRGALDRAKAELRSAISALTPRHRFSLIMFSGHPAVYSRRLLPGTPEVKRRVLQYVDRQRARGGTDPLPALQLALCAPRALDHVVMVTDARLKETAFRWIARYQRWSRALRGRDKPPARLTMISLSGSARDRRLASQTVPR